MVDRRALLLASLSTRTQNTDACSVWLYAETATASFPSSVVLKVTVNVVGVAAAAAASVAAVGNGAAADPTVQPAMTGPVNATSGWW